MNRTGKGLGNLSSRFFAYTQLKKKAIIRTGDLLKVLGITVSQERDLLRRLSDSGWIVRLKRGVYLVPPRIPAGGRYSPGVGLILRKLMDEYSGKYQVCGPTAFNFYGLDDQVANITSVYNDRISGSRTIGSLVFQFIKIATERLGDTAVAKTRDEPGIVYSSRIRTLMDAVYDWKRFNSLPRGYGWIRNAIMRDSDIAFSLADTVFRYGNQAAARRIGYLLDSMKSPQEAVSRLLDRRSGSKALIPWIPGRAARGTVNRKWGIIVNG